MADFSITGEVRLNSDPAEKSTSKWTVAAGNMIADFAKKASAELGKVVKSGIDYNASMESYLTNFKVMLGNEELAAEKLSELRKIAASTPFALSDLTEGTQTLLQFGIAADDTTGVLKQLGDISLGNADKLQTLVRAYGKMSSAKKVTLENVNMMIDAGFNPLNQICEATGESMSDLYKRISDGKVSFSELQAAVSAATSEGGQFYNGMLEASQTFSGRISTLKDNVSALTGELTSGLFAALGELVVKLNEVVTSFLDSDEKMAQLKDTIGIAASVVAAAGAAFLTYKGYVALATAAEIAHTAYTTAMTAAHAAAEAGTTGLALAQAALNAVISANPVGLFVAALAALATGLVTAYQTSETFRNAVNSAFTAVEKIAQNAIGTVVDWLNELVAKIRGAAAALANLKNGVGAAQEAYDAAYNGYMDDYNQSKRDKAAAKRKALHDERVKQAQEGLNVAMDANPILLVISLIGMLVGALLNFASTNKNVANGMNDVWSGVADFMSYIFEGLMYVLGLFVEQFVIEINALIGAYNLVAQLWGGHIDYVSNPAWDYAKKIQKEREDRKNARLAKQEQAELDAEYARQSGDAEKKQLDAEYAKKAAELARAKLTEDDPGMLDAEKAVAAADYKKSVADLEKKLLDAEYKKQSAQIGKKTAADATALADLEKQLVEAENTLRMGDLERELLQLDYEKTLRDLEEKYKPGTPAEPEKPDASTDPGTPGTTPDKDNTDAIRDNTEALLAANSKLAEMVRQADSLVLSDNMAISRSVAVSGTAKVAAAANQYHREGDTNITQNIYSKAQTAADLQREARWEADRAKAQKR